MIERSKKKLIADSKDEEIKLVLVNRKERERLKMNKVKCWIVIFLIFSPYIVLAEGVNIPVKNEKVYSVQESKLYNLKVKLKPKVVEEKVYWQNREKIDWNEEIKNWKFGFLSQNENLLPIVIYKENFYSEEEDYQGRYLWGKSNMRILVFNPVNAEIQCDLEFSADSYKSERTLEIWVNGRIIKKIEVPAKEEFNHFKIEDILLRPGINAIRFFCPEGTDELQLKGKGEIRQVSIKFKELKFKNIKSHLVENIKKLTEDIKYVPQGNFLDIVFSASASVIFSRDIDMDLKEFPFFNLNTELKRKIDVKLAVFLGVDYTGDGSIDGYLNLEELGEYNIFELAKNKWQEVNEYKNDFKLKKIIFLILPQNVKEDTSGVLRIKNLGFYNDNSLILIGKQIKKADLSFKNINVKSKITELKDGIQVLGYFDAGPVEIKKNELLREEVQHKKREIEEIQVLLPLDESVKKYFPYFSCSYKLDKSEIQEINLAVLLDKDGEKRVLKVGGQEYKNLEGKIEFNLKKIGLAGFDIKALILRLKRRDFADCSLTNSNWYSFKLSDIKFYNKFPYPVKSEQSRSRFISLLRVVNPEIVKIDGNVFRLTDFKSGHNFEDLEREVLSKKIKLTKGEHNYERLENDTFDVEWAILEPAYSNKADSSPKENRRFPTGQASLIAHSQEPKIIFKKINPTKYLVKVNGAKNPFWLVFSESFHKQWKLYLADSSSLIVHSKKGKAVHNPFKEIVANYPKLGVKEAKHLMKFTPRDIKYLFRKSLNAKHQLVNGYANGWYVEPKKLGLGENFVLVIYFWPQSLFYLGLGISAITLLFCIIYLVYDFIRRKRKNLPCS